MEDFVTIQIARKLKEKGYPQVKQDTLAMYDECGKWCSLAPTIDEEYYSYYDFDDRDCVCPTISQALKWLRKKEFLVTPVPFYFNAEGICTGWNCDIWVNGNYEHCNRDKKTYEEAALAGIEYILDNLI